jgi:hypothetical protein
VEGVVAIIRSWRSWVKDENKMTFTRDKIIGRDASGRVLHHSAPMPLDGFNRDAAPVGSEVGGIGEASFGYAENNRTMRAYAQGKIGGTDPQREDGAYRHVLARWKTGSEVEIIEEGDSMFLLLWEPPRPGEGNPQGATTSDPISRSATTMNDPERTFADPPVGPRATTSDWRLRNHSAKPTPQAKRALTNIRKNADAATSINDANRDFWGKK